MDCATTKVPSVLGGTMKKLCRKGRSAWQEAVHGIEVDVNLRRLVVPALTALTLPSQQVPIRPQGQFDEKGYVVYTYLNASRGNSGLENFPCRRWCVGGTPRARGTFMWRCSVPS
jgi:hypothetical protein